MKEKFGVLPSGEEASLYTISCGFLTAVVTDYGATLVKLMVPDKNGVPADVVLGYDHVDGYRTGSAYLGATVGRNANRIGGAAFELNGRTITLSKNDNGNNLHSGPDGYNYRMWKVLSHTDSSISFTLISPQRRPGFPR